MIKILFTGHVDHGKSTTIGHLLYKIGYVSEHEFKQLEKEAIEAKMEKWKYAWILDLYAEERERGKTIDFNKVEMKYEDNTYLFIDTPGHKTFIRQLIYGINYVANPKTIIGCLVVSVIANEFNSGMKGGQTREDLIIIRASGIENLVVLLNKIDAIKWSEDVLKERKKVLDDFIVKLGFKRVEYLPISGYNGTGLLDIINISQNINKLICDEKNEMLESKECTMILAQIKMINCDGIIISAGYVCVMHVRDK